MSPSLDVKTFQIGPSVFPMQRRPMSLDDVVRVVRLKIAGDASVRATAPVSGVTRTLMSRVFFSRTARFVAWTTNVEVARIPMNAVPSMGPERGPGESAMRVRASNVRRVRIARGIHRHRSAEPGHAQPAKTVMNVPKPILIGRFVSLKAPRYPVQVSVSVRVMRPAWRAA